jgi:hypothetical protein
MSNIAIFKQDGAGVSTKRELSDFAKTFESATNASTSRRIQTNANGTFKRLVNGKQIGDAIRGEINVIIVYALPKVSRIYYKEDFDLSKEATLPNCWSNLGDKPEEAALDKQHTNCADCPMNIAGSGKSEKSRACRFQRRISVLVENDGPGDVYQFNIPAKSIFGKGTGNVHPFESYIKFLLANGESPDNVVTNISYDLNADSMELAFTPLRGITDEEYALVKAAQARPETQMYTKITVAQADKVTKQPLAIEQKPKIARSDEPEEDIEVIEEPIKRPAKKVELPPQTKQSLVDVVDDWSKD